MLDILWKLGAIRVAGPDGLRRLSDLADRDPAAEELPRSTSQRPGRQYGSYVMPVLVTPPATRGVCF
ncbi:MAG: hypothetical protein JOY82_23910 [Streptosporangiaceae bacterium]|nr:hypothetical protein [Streptosporangiaceae bacterium]MBV9857529.1 hypothetical protein [Streptosporangiaceae bacterium]